MSLLPKDAKKIEIESSTVDFFEYIQDGLTCYQFDTSECGPPEPMINAMLGLQLLDDASKRLVMINHKAPGGLFPKIEANFEFNINEIEDGNRVQVIFKARTGDTSSTNFSDNTCG